MTYIHRFRVANVDQSGLAFPQAVRTAGVRWSARLLFCVLAAWPADAPAQVLHVAELTSEQIRVLDRATTVVILPGGILEQHAAHLPSFSDGFMNQALADALAEAIAARPGWRALLFPIIPLGSGGANELSGRFSWPGTYAVRTGTLRAVFMDLATELGEQGFRWIFVVHRHGSPWHNRALDQAGGYFRDIYDGRMVHLTGIELDWEEVDQAYRALVTPEMLAEDANSVHAGLSETSRVMYVRPDLVSAELVRNTPSISTPLAALVERAKAPGWPGYFGAPRHGSPAVGRAAHEAAAKAWIAIALRILDGEDERSMKRYADTMLAIPAIQAVGKSAAEYDASVAARQQAWLNRHK